jgi:hypothetical protein
MNADFKFSPDPGRLRDALNAQFLDIARRLPTDIRLAMEDAEQRCSFLSYHLTDFDNKPLSEKTLASLNVTIDDIRDLQNFERIFIYCDNRFYRVIFDYFLDFTDGSRLIKLTIDGWAR